MPIATGPHQGRAIALMSSLKASDWILWKTVCRLGGTAVKNARIGPGQLSEVSSDAK